MKFKVLPGETIIFHVKVEKVEGIEKGNPVAVQVAKVHKGAIVVPASESFNGWARIVCHGTSEIDGGYWYRFKDLKSKDHSVDIVRMEKIDGAQIKGNFIEN